jgi:hypothetical protein
MRFDDLKDYSFQRYVHLRGFTSVVFDSWNVSTSFFPVTPRGIPSHHLDAQERIEHSLSSAFTIFREKRTPLSAVFKLCQINQSRIGRYCCCSHSNDQHEHSAPHSCNLATKQSDESSFPSPRLRRAYIPLPSRPQSMTVPIVQAFVHVGSCTTHGH